MFDQQAVTAINDNGKDAPSSTSTPNSPQVEASCELAPVQEFSSRIAGINYEAPTFATVEEFKAAFEEAEEGAHKAAAKKFDAEAELILYLAMVQSFLSERGANAGVRKAAGIKAGFEEWYENFRQHYDVEYAFKTIQHKIAQLRGGCPDCGRLNGDHKKSCPLFSKGFLEQTAEDAKTNGKTGGGRKKKINPTGLKNAYYADRYIEVIGVVTNKPKDAKPEQVLALIEANAILAYEDMDANEAKSLRVPKPQHTKLEKIGIKIAKVIASDAELRRKLPRSSSKGWKLFDFASDLLKAAGEEVTIDATALEAAGKPKSLTTCKSMGIPFEIDPNLVNETISTLTAVSDQLQQGELATRVRSLRHTLIHRTDGSGVTPKVMPSLKTAKVNGKAAITLESKAVDQAGPSQAAEAVANKNASVIVMESRRCYEKNELTVKKGSIYVIGRPELGAIDSFEGEDANDLAWAEVERLTQPVTTAA